MKSIYLFPNKLKIPALVLFIISLVLLVLHFNEVSPELNMKVFAIVSDPFLDNKNRGTFTWVDQNMYNELIDILYITSGLMLAFSKEKIEDEMITLIRYKSLVNTTYIIFILVILSELLIYGMSFGYVIMFFYYVFIVLLNIFYYTKLFIYKKQFSYENED